MPSSAEGSWSGVAGIRKLLGKRAFDQVTEEESHRVLKEAANYLQTNGFGVVFHKDAWNGLSSNGNYSLEMAKTGELKSTFNRLHHIPLFGVPPTRLLGPSRVILRKILKRDTLDRNKFNLYDKCGNQKGSLKGDTLSPDTWSFREK